jgi:alpha-1,3/alpha-1,6-mannosyltransferase
MPVKRQNIVFFHPDLGIGGAERLVIDAAVGLQNRGHTVTIFTSHCDPQHCFDEARDGKHCAVPTTSHRSSKKVAEIGVAM